LNDSFLLDTSVVIWVLEGSSRISKRATRALFDPSKTLIVSVVSVWEIILKHQARKLELGTPLAAAVDLIMHDSPWAMLPLATDALRRLAELPLLHKDPFDRMLVAQAQHDGLTIITPDVHIRKYKIPTLW
jgi:PIN domain nuclease of toxin-antitoxin system